MADPLIELPQLEARIGRTLETPEDDQAEAFIHDASALIRRFVSPSDPESVFEMLPDDVPDDIVPVVVRMVHRALENPLGLGQEVDGTYTAQKSGLRGGDSGVYMSPQDEDDIRAAIPRTKLRAITLVSPYSGDDVVESILGS